LRYPNFNYLGDQMFRLLLIVFVTVILAACSGGGGNAAPTFSSATTANVLEGATVVMDVSASDPEGSTVTLSLSGTDFSLFTLTGNALAFASAPDFEVPGSAAGTNEYSVMLSATDGTNITDQSLMITVTDATEGRVVDGPLSGAKVFLDLDGDLIQDDNEPSVSTDATGFFKLPVATAAEGATLKLVSIGGTDTSTGEALSDMALVSDVPASGQVIVTPLSTVVSAATTPAGKAAVLVSLGINGSAEEALAKDVWALAEAGDAEAIKIQTANLAISAVLQSATSLIDTSDATSAAENATNIMALLAAQIVVQAAAGADLFDKTVLATVLKEGVEAYATENQPTLVITDAVFAAIGESVATVIVIIEGAGNPTTADAISVATIVQSTLQTAVEEVVTSGDAAVFTAASSATTLFTNASASVIAIVQIATNSAPVISSASTFTAVENQTAIGSITASDADSDSLTYTISGTEILISSTGVLSFNAAPVYAPKASYMATVSVSDGVKTTTQDITVTITAVVNVAPVLSNITNCSKANENTLKVCDLSATDADNDTLTFTIDGDDASLLSVVDNTILKFNTNPDYESPADENNNNEYLIILNVSDGKLTTSSSLKLQVSNVEENQFGEGQFGTSVME